MTYRWIYPAPEFDSGAEKRIKNIFIAYVSLSEILTFNFAPDRAQYPYEISYFT